MSAARGDDADLRATLAQQASAIAGLTSAVASLGDRCASLQAENAALRERIDALETRTLNGARGWRRERDAAREASS